MTTQAEIDQARAAGIRAAADAQRIADNATAAQPSLLDRIALGTYYGVNDLISNTGAAVHNALEPVTDPIKEGVNGLKWIAIVVLVLVAILAALWIGAAVFGFAWAGNLLRDIVPSLAPAAVAVSRASR